MSTTVRIAGVVRESVVDGNGIRFVVFTQGCPHACKGCHNPQSHDFSGGYDCEIEKIVEEVKKNPLLSGVTLSGGEPLVQVKPLLILAQEIKKLNLGLIIYTGYVFEEIVQKAQEDKALMSLLKLTDVIVDGKYEEKFKNLKLKFRGSSNQRIIDVAKSLKENTVCETEI